MPTLSPEDLSRKLKEIELNCAKLAHIEQLADLNHGQIKQILRVLVGDLENGDLGLKQRVKMLEDYKKKQELKAKEHEKSFRQLRNTIVAGIIVGVFLTIVNFATPVLQEFQTHKIIEELQQQGRLQTPAEKRALIKEVIKEMKEQEQEKK